MRELSLFTGAGGGIYASAALGWQTIGYVEYDDYRQRVIAQRIADGVFDNAPIFGGIETFLSDGYAAGYTGLVDIITAGFPCQPFSSAGKRRGAADERNKWPETRGCIGIIRPRYALLENSPRLISSGYLAVIVGELAALGYDCRWCVVSAADVGAPHERKRVWILAADADSSRRERTQLSLQHGRQDESGAEPFRRCKTAANARSDGLERPIHMGVSQAPNGYDARRQATGGALSQGWQGDNPEPGLLGMDDGLANWKHRIAAAGDGWVPAAAVEAWRQLTEDLQ